MPAQTNVRGRLTAKRELVIEAVRAWAAALEGAKLEPAQETEDLLEAWREYREAEKKAGRGMGGAG